MSNHRENIRIQGDGNAVGNHNQITIIKNDNRRGGGGGGRGGEGLDPAAFFGAGVVLLVALVVSTYYFARHADAVYNGLTALTALEAVVALVVTIMYLLREDYMLGTKAGLVMIMSMLASMSLYFVHDSYPPKLIDLAQQASGVKAFWCGLSVYGRQTSLLHTRGSALFC